MTVPAPTWLDKVPDTDKAFQHRRYLLRTAALLASPQGTTSAMARRLRLHPSSLTNWLNKKKPLPRELAEKIESATDGAVKASDLLGE